MFPFPFSFTSSLAELDQLDNLYSFEFDGVGAYMDLGSPSALNLTGNMSISVWINTNTVAIGGKAIVCDVSAAANASQFCLEINRTAGKISALANGSTVALTGSSTLSINTWYHVVLTRSGSASNWDYSIYINGVSDGTANTAQNPDSQQGSAIGRYGQSSSGYFNGEIDEVGVFNVALTGAEVLSIYNATTTGKTADLSALSTPPIAWYRMGD